MIFSKFPNRSVLYLFHYLPSWSGTSDIRSKAIILDVLKGGRSLRRTRCIEMLAQNILPFIKSPCVAVGIPSSSIDNVDNGVMELVQTLAKQSHGFVQDGSNCLYREYSVLPAHRQSNLRTKAQAARGLSFRDTSSIFGKNVLVIDDVVTSGSSMEAAMDLLKVQGVSKVVGLGISKTISNQDMDAGFIFDLDQTLFDTRCLKEYRKKGNWKAVYAHASEIGRNIDLENFVKGISKKYNVCIVTSSPLSYAKLFVVELGIPDNCIVAYHDTRNHKPGLAPYVLAKSILQRYESNIFVVGDSLSDLYPAYRMGMKTIHAKWWSDLDDSYSRPSFNPNFEFSRIDEFLKVFSWAVH